MAGRGDRRATPRLVFGGTVRMGFRGPKRAKTCANRKDDQLGILSRCGCDDRLKTFTTSNHRTSPGRMSNVLPLSAMTADEYKQLPPEEKEHFFQCPNAVSLRQTRTPGRDLPRDKPQAKASHSENQGRTDSETSFPPLGSPRRGSNAAREGSTSFQARSTETALKHSSRFEISCFTSRRRFGSLAS